MSSGSKRHQVRRMMAGLLSLTMVATLVTPASSQVYAAALDDTRAEAEVPEAEPAEDGQKRLPKKQRLPQPKWRTRPLRR